MSIAIHVKSLSKKYCIRYEAKEQYTTLRDEMASSVKRVAKRFLKPASGNTSQQEFWALRDISFEVEQGERIGIIGRNGAGKSTLLKVLGRITEPTMGLVRIKGRVSSLLEVGTGFHPELTGRENIYLNGAILGMSRMEINQKFAEIVAFAEVEKFLDTPVKRYSSGMQVRLAFAVAAHLEPEILLVDEVLAVGDAAFQKKCLGKLDDISRTGRTVVFVSHNMAAISQLCRSAILLEHGRLINIDTADKIIKEYLNHNGQKNESMVNLEKYNYRQGTQAAAFAWAQLEDANGQVCRDYSIGEDIVLKFCIRKMKPEQQKVKLAIQIRSSDGFKICNIVDVDSGFQIEDFNNTEIISVSLQDIRFYPDQYYISLWLGSITSTEVFDYVEDCLSFEIIDGGKLTARRLPRSAGILFLTPEWKRICTDGKTSVT